jgi:hypothetical protein
VWSGRRTGEEGEEARVVFAGEVAALREDEEFALVLDGPAEGLGGGVLA